MPYPYAIHIWGLLGTSDKESLFWDAIKAVVLPQCRHGKEILFVPRLALGI